MTSPSDNQETTQPAVEALVAYETSAIESREGLMAMRKSPTLWLPDLEHGGITHDALEVITNSNDELIAGGNPNSYLQVILCRDEARASFAWIIKDTGRGIPFETEAGEKVFMDCITKPHTSGKFNQNSYAISGGQFGCGFKVAAATSTHLTCISHRPTGTAMLTVDEGLHEPRPVVDMTYQTTTGVTSVFEPDASIFAGVNTYADGGYFAVLSLMRQMVFFRQRNMQFRKIERPIGKEFWSIRDPREADAYLEPYLTESDLIWDARNNDGSEWIKTYWNLHRNFNWRSEISLQPEDLGLVEELNDQIKDVIIKLYSVKGDRAGGVFALVNSVPIPNRGSDHVAGVIRKLKDSMVGRIDEAPKAKFFMESYTLPLFYAISVDYKGARFSNATKTDWKDEKFRSAYAQLLEHWFTQTERGTALIASLFEHIESDIDARYLDSLGKRTDSRDTSRLWSKLAKYKNFVDAEPLDGDRSSCELFLLEGNSTGGGTDYDTERQGFYYLQGKPLNPIRDSNGNRNLIIEKFLKDPILSDILTIINFNPRNPDYSRLNYGRVLITPDADKLAA